MKLLLLLLIFPSIFLAGCWKTYDEKKPDDYYKYWQNEKDKKTGIIYPGTEEYKEERRGKR